MSESTSSTFGILGAKSADTLDFVSDTAESTPGETVAASAAELPQRTAKTDPTVTAATFLTPLKIDALLRAEASSSARTLSSYRRKISSMRGSSSFLSRADSIARSNLASGFFPTFEATRSNAASVAKYPQTADMAARTAKAEPAITAAQDAAAAAEVAKSPIQTANLVFVEEFQRLRNFATAELSRWRLTVSNASSTKRTNSARVTAFGASNAVVRLSIAAVIMLTCVKQ